MLGPSATSAAPSTSKYSSVSLMVSRTSTPRSCLNSGSSSGRSFAARAALTTRAKHGVLVALARRNSRETPGSLPRGVKDPADLGATGWHSLSVGSRASVPCFVVRKRQFSHAVLGVGGRTIGSDVHVGPNVHVLTSTRQRGGEHGLSAVRRSRSSFLRALAGREYR